ncbi:hypothetical protein TWF192_004986 [Orbilia oligospora]|uniref:Threonine/serine exporter-like N-terminal domain-containing protein n=1 Tax=Orbilia oligospora TaxID=2813651 RepID=A0A6G1MBH7_ORBOL|nr:hypothetical protein TWF679_010814 [Orbilia oligospora]KAF3205227.1 hypothetical protein TWF191_001936 [Orbilia oligospora]KAF3251008.1 hypothetical protein TWF192_004986 [Orbilia oligospora]
MASNPGPAGTPGASSNPLASNNPFADPPVQSGQRHDRRNTEPLPYPVSPHPPAARGPTADDEIEDISPPPLFSRYSTGPEAENLVRRHANTFPRPVPPNTVSQPGAQAPGLVAPQSHGQGQGQGKPPGYHSDDDDSDISTDEDEDLAMYFKRREPANGVLSSLLQLYGPGGGTEAYRSQSVPRSPRSRSKSAVGAKTTTPGEQATTESGQSAQPDTAAEKEKMQMAMMAKEAGVDSDSDDDDWKSFSARPRWYQHSSMSRFSLVPETRSATPTMEVVGDVASVLSMGERPSKLGKRERLKALAKRFKGRRGNEELTITVHIAETLQRQKYLLKLCRALMLCGAPSHRIEDFLQISAAVLAVNASFVYLPGTIIISFQDPKTHTSDVQVVKSGTSLDLGKLQYIHIIYKEVLHDVISVETGTEKLEKLIRKPPLRNVWFKVLLYGGASASIAPLFNARVKDLPFAFLLGMVVALLGLVINPKSEAFANVFEIMGTIIVSFFARAFGSIRMNGEELFCFSGITQGAIAPLLLPGYAILLGALELQSKKLVAGAVRMFYAIIYSVLLWFGISIGTALYGFVDPSATNLTECLDQNLQEFRFFYVPLFTFFVLLANQARWKQAPAMLVISLVGYTVNYFSQGRFPHTPQVANGLAALTVGVLGNLYSRVVHQAAFTAMVPAILLQVQSGIASSGSLMSGLTVAMTIVGGRNAMIPADADSINIAAGANSQSGFVVDGGAGQLALGLVAISVAISFGLFLSSVIVYPLGKSKKQSAIFAF